MWDKTEMDRLLSLRNKDVLSVFILFALDFQIYCKSKNVDMFFNTMIPFYLWHNVLYQNQSTYNLSKQNKSTYSAQNKT